MYTETVTETRPTETRPTEAVQIEVPVRAPDEVAGSRIGGGARPALVVVDLAKAWTSLPGPWHCPNSASVIDANLELLEAARDVGIPRLFTTTAFEPDMSDAGLWVRKLPALSRLRLGTEGAEIDGRLKRRRDEPVLRKTFTSAFSSTWLATYLTSQQVDTVIVTGLVASSCVRHTVEDALSLGFRPIVAREAVGDRMPSLLPWTLFELDTKFADVMDTEEVCSYIRSIQL